MKSFGAISKGQGQAITEYVVMVSMCMLMMMGAMALFLEKAGDFYLNIIKVVSLPFP